MTAARPADPAGRLAELEALRAAATPGPWIPATAPAEGSDETHAEYLTNGLRPDEGRPLWVAWAPVAAVHEGDDVEYVVPVVTGDGPTSEANARYVATVHDALPDLCAAVRGVLALADDCDLWARANADLAGWPQQSASARDFHEGMHKAWSAAADRIRAAVASALDRGTE